MLPGGAGNVELGAALLIFSSNGICTGAFVPPATGSPGVVEGAGTGAGAAIGAGAAGAVDTGALGIGCDSNSLSCELE